MSSRAAIALVLSILAATLAPAGCKKEATGPDLSTPRAAAVTFSKALESGDVATARLASNASGIETELIDAMAQSASGVKRLNAAASAKYGEKARRLVHQSGSLNVAKNLANGDVDQNAERATVRSKDGRDSVQLARIDGKWRVDVGALTRGKDISRVVPFFRAAGKASRQVADEIDAGKYATVEEAQLAVAGQIKALVPEYRHEQFTASTQPKPKLDIPQVPAEDF